MTVPISRDLLNEKCQEVYGLPGTKSGSWEDKAVTAMLLSLYFLCTPQSLAERV